MYTILYTYLRISIELISWNNLEKIKHFNFSINIRLHFKTQMTYLLNCISFQSNILHYHVHLVLLTLNKSIRFRAEMFEANHREYFVVLFFFQNVDPSSNGVQCFEQFNYVQREHNWKRENNSMKRSSWFREDCLHDRTHSCGTLQWITSTTDLAAAFASIWSLWWVMGRFQLPHTFPLPLLFSNGRVDINHEIISDISIQSWPSFEWYARHGANIHCSKTLHNAFIKRMNIKSGACWVAAIISIIEDWKKRR